MTATALHLDPLETVSIPRPRLRVIDGEGRSPDSVGRDGRPRRVALTQREIERREVFRRRRFLAALAVTAIVLAISAALGVSPTSFGAADADSSSVVDSAIATDRAIPQVHVVVPGDTYAGIAAGLGVEQPQDVAQHLRAANGGADLEVGQRIVFTLARLD